MSFSHDTCLDNRCHFPKKGRRFVEHLPRTWMNVTSKREHFKRKDRLPVAAFFRGDLFVFGDIKLMEPTLNSSQDWGLKLGARFFPNFFTKKKKTHETKRWGTSYHPPAGVVFEPPQKNHALVVPHPSIHLAPNGRCWDLLPHLEPLKRSVPTKKSIPKFPKWLFFQKGIPSKRVG